MRRFVLRLATIAAAAGTSILAGGHLQATPIAAPDAIHADGLAVVARAQFIHLGQPYCWYPYGWAGAGWYWCGHGTRVGFGWGGAYGWNGWTVPRSYSAMRVAPGYRLRRFR